MSKLSSEFSGVTRVGLDLAKHVFQIHAVDASGAAIDKRQVRRAKLLDYFAALPACTIGMEACSSAHHWAHQPEAMGHKVMLIPPIYPARRATARHRGGARRDRNPEVAIAPAPAIEVDAGGGVTKTPRFAGSRIRSGDAARRERLIRTTASTCTGAVRRARAKGVRAGSDEAQVAGACATSGKAKHRIDCLRGRWGPERDCGHHGIARQSDYPVQIGDAERHARLARLQERLICSVSAPRLSGTFIYSPGTPCRTSMLAFQEGSILPLGSDRWAFISDPGQSVTSPSAMHRRQ